MHTRIAAPVLAALALALLGACTAPPAPGTLTAEQTRFAAEVAPLDVHLTDPRTAVKLGDSICTDLAGGMSPVRLAAKTQRFTGGEVAVDLEKATRIVASAQANLCS